MYVAPVHPWCGCVLQVPSSVFVLPILVSDGVVSLLEMIEDTPLELVSPLEVAQGVNTLAVVSVFFQGMQVVWVARV